MKRKRYQWLVGMMLILAMLACNLPGSTDTDDASTDNNDGTGDTVSSEDNETNGEQPADPGPAPTSEPGIIPAPLYFIGEDAQIYRLEVDGVTLTQITSEFEPVGHYDVSEEHGEIVYTIGESNDLIKVDAFGNNREVLVDGPSSEDMGGNGEPPRVSSPVWSPDGRQISYTFQGVLFMTGAGYSSRLMIQNDIYPTDFDNLPEGELRMYFPEEWSPDGSRLLLNFGVWPEFGGMALLEPVKDGSPDAQNLYDITLPPDPQGNFTICCHQTWTPDGSKLYISNEVNGLFTPGLWVVDAATGQMMTLVSGLPTDGDFENGMYTLFHTAQLLADGQLYSFMNEAQGAEASYQGIGLIMTRSGPDGVSGRTALRNDDYLLGRVLWAADGSGAIIEDQSQSATNGYDEFPPILWLDSSDSAAVTLVESGQRPQWGSRNPPKTAPTMADLFPGSVKPIAALEAVAATPPGSVLPTPLYYLSDEGQVWRTETDGVTTAQITNEAEPINRFEVSRAHGYLLYTSGNDLIRTDPVGGNRVVLLDGPSLEDVEVDPFLRVGAAVWSSDGTQIAVEWQGVVLMTSSGGNPQQMIKNIAFKGASSSFPTDVPLINYYPNQFSPDDSYLMLNEAYFPHGGGIAVMDMAASQPGSPVIRSVGGTANEVVCCDEIWSPDSQSIFYASASLGILSPGLWQANVNTGESKTLIEGVLGADYGPPFNFVAFPELLSDGRLYFFMVTMDDYDPNEGEGAIRLMMHSAAADGVSDRKALREDAFLLGDVLWSPDGKGAVIADRTETSGAPSHASGSLLWLPTDGTSRIGLPGIGWMLQWGR